MKLTVITAESGQVIAVQHGHTSENRTVTPYAVITDGPGQRLHEIEMPDEDAVEDAAELHRRVARYMR
jgi:hypothetical protein